jgi:predicted nucleic acid-binding protein
MNRYLLDSNHLGEAIGKISSLRDRIRQACRQGCKFATCWPAIFELEMGIVQTKDPVACRRNVKILLKEVRIRPLDWDLLDTFGHIHLLLKKRGRILSFVDKILAALAMNENATLLTTDLDFQGLPELRTENWLS